ncbi:MAG: radical SAM protein [Patescibacteria group bacterium]
MKIALIQCPVWGTYDPPLALAQLSACLKKDGHEICALDLNIELYLSRQENYKNTWAWEQSLFWYNQECVSKFLADNKDTINKYVEQIVDGGYGVVCFSVTAASKLSSLELARSIKKRNKGIIIIFGGTLFFDRNFIKVILSDASVDIVACGEGEVTLSELARLIENKEHLDACRGIAFKNKGIRVNPERPLIGDLDDLPFLDFSQLPLSNYDDKGHVAFLSSRGCWQQCVFCSSRTFWAGYRRMSAKRIFDEIHFHYKNNDEVRHIDFLDLMFNGDIEELNSFCDLMIGSELKGRICWAANAIIRPEMTPALLNKMKAAGCKHLIYGIESGSQKVLNLMKKRYRIEDADIVIKATHEAGIVVTANFMFGFPGESEEDFGQTLGFLKRNARYLDRAYPSRTFCALEEDSYLHAHLEEFGIKPNPPNHLYWESLDSQNTYPERLRRCEEFCNLASSLGIEVASGVQTSVELDRWFNLLHYYEQKKDIKNMLQCCLNYYKSEPDNEFVVGKIEKYFYGLQEEEREKILGARLFSELQIVVNKIGSKCSALALVSNQQVEKIGREKSFALAIAEQRDNKQLTETEYHNNESSLNSWPRVLFIQASGPCNSSCVFCSRGDNYKMFDLEEFKKGFVENFYFLFYIAEKIVLTGSGEFLLLPEAEKILDYFDENFPHIEKMFATNGSGLLPSIAKKIVDSKSRYTIHFSLHASNHKLHKTLTRMDNFYKILGQLKYLLDIRKDKERPAVHLTFVATTLNIEDLPNFVRLASNLGVDKVVCYYNYIYVPAQKYLSCFFKQDITNSVLDEAEDLARSLKVQLELPPRFKQKEYPKLDICREPWTQVMFDIDGNVLPCDASEDFRGNLKNAKHFHEIWNGQHYRRLRESLINGTSDCFKYCFRANPAAVNDFRSHVIRRGREASEIDVYWGDNF